MLAEFWIAYYWPFVDERRQILQGPQTFRDGRLRNDMAFRPHLTQLRVEWEKVVGGSSRPSDGFFIINELRVPRKLCQYPVGLRSVYNETLSAICSALQKPIRYAGPGEWTVFARPASHAQLCGRTVGVPATQNGDICLVIPSELWQTFRVLSLWVEALCIHEWCMFTQRTRQSENRAIDRGETYHLLTDRPGNRRPLTWERNHVDLLLMEGKRFICPWTERCIQHGVDYEMDHLVPVSVYPINELWNLVPSDPAFNAHVKRDRLPSIERLLQARPHLALTYANYSGSKTLSDAIQEDVAVRFSTIVEGSPFAESVARAVIGFIDGVAAARNLARFC